MTGAEATALRELDVAIISPDDASSRAAVRRARNAS